MRNSPNAKELADLNTFIIAMDISVNYSVCLLFSCFQNQIELLQEGFYSFGEGVPCPDALCPFNTRSQHFHCNQPRCFYVTDREDILIMHSKDFHDNIDIMEGFRFFDRTVDCRMPSCHRYLFLKTY